jgi:hypothetical protein
MAVAKLGALTVHLNLLGTIPLPRIRIKPIVLMIEYGTGVTDVGMVESGYAPTHLTNIRITLLKSVKLQLLPQTTTLQLRHL